MVWQQVPLDRIYFDDTTGVPGTVWPIGTPEVPSDVIADIITMCTARNLHKIAVHGALTLGAAMEHYCFFGHEHYDIADIVNLNGQNMAGSTMDRLIVTGALGTGLLTLVDCVVSAVTLFAGRMNNSSFYASACSFRDASFIDLVNCESIYGAVTITVQAPTRASIKDWRGNLILTAQDGGVLNVRGFKGSLEIDAMTAGALSIYATGADITINADCTGGTINIWGSAVVTNNAAGAVVNDYTIDQRAANIDTQLDGMLVQVPYFNLTETILNDVITLFEFDALGATIREIFVSFYLALDAAPTYTLTWEKTRPDDLVTFTVEAIPALANIVTPAAAGYYSYKLGELAQGLQGRFRIAQSNAGNANNAVDGWAVALMVL